MPNPNKTDDDTNPNTNTNPSTIKEHKSVKTKQEIKEEVMSVFSDFPQYCLDAMASSNADLISEYYHYHYYYNYFYHYYYYHCHYCYH
jgi:hypothetical protein